MCGEWSSLYRLQALPVPCRELQSLKIEEAEEEQAKDEVYEQAKDLCPFDRPGFGLVDPAALAGWLSPAARMIETDGAEGVVGAPDGMDVEVLGRRGPVGGDEA